MSKPEASVAYERRSSVGIGHVGVQDGHCARQARNKYAAFLIRYQASSLKTLPIVSPYALALREALPSEAQRPEALLQAFGSDPFLAARFLGDANSMFFNPSHREILTLQEALEHLGLEHALRLLAQPQPEAKCFVSEAFGTFWAHSVAVSVAAQQIARLMRIPGIDPEAARVLGLIHDIGYLVEARYDARLTSNPQPVNGESADQHTDRARLGASLAVAWSLPQCMQRVFEDPAVGPTRAVATLIRLARSAAQCGPHSAVYDERALEALGLQISDLARVAQTARHHCQEALHVVGLLSIASSLAPA